MGKKDRYDLDGAEDTLGENEQQSSPSETQHPNENDSTNVATVAETENTDTSGNKSMQETEADSSNSVNRNKIPHRVRYDSPKQERVSKAFFLDSEQDLPRIRELHTLADTEFNEKVHQIDVYLAAFRSDLSDESFLEEMNQIGYGYFE